MRKMLLAAAPAAALAIAGCGSDAKSCQTASAPVAPTQGCTSLRADADVTVILRPPTGSGCQSCAQTSPSCTFDPATNHLDTIYRECAEDAGCGSGCVTPQPAFSCAFHTPAASGVTLFYNVSGDSVLPNPVTLIAGGGPTSCTL